MSASKRITYTRGNEKFGKIGDGSIFKEMSKKAPPMTSSLPRLHGYGLCLWRLNRPQEALAVFELLLWLNPTGNQSARFNHASILARLTWEAVEQE